MISAVLLAKISTCAPNSPARAEAIQKGVGPGREKIKEVAA